jgi:hypothetical protein
MRFSNILSGCGRFLLARLERELAKTCVPATAVLGKRMGFGTWRIESRAMAYQRYSADKARDYRGLGRRVNPVRGVPPTAVKVAFEVIAGKSQLAIHKLPHFGNYDRTLAD